jgi:hypothetical protein
LLRHTFLPFFGLSSPAYGRKKHGSRTETAQKRFSHFGCAKTMMAEIAADCSMSPGYLYRHSLSSAANPS